MRAFIAAEASGEVTDYLNRLNDKISMNGVRRLKTFHLTLHFLGEITEEKAEEIKRIFSDFRFEPIKTKIKGVGYFPEFGDIRVVWVGLHPEDKIMELQKRVDELLEKAGFEKEIRFKPHMTIARVKFLKKKIWLKDKVRQTKTEPEKFFIDKIKLMKSTLTKEGPIYETLAEF